ncbi:acyl-CoA dehydrogenase family protein [Glycomyces sp. YM15]|uniref:acyl-CoA dehydrogenase family protein n=1 Tax=Glycomyces sp. YM15 TaxID=2800446 RepID=UPI0019655D6F|nr:acyl-CoA dehydrogenase family protein [Glycomyces sp. YM15]
MNGPLDWLGDLRPSLRASKEAWAAWRRLDADLETLAAADPGRGDQRARSSWLALIRRDLAAHVPPEGTGAALWQAGAQFISGYRDLDLREATGAGHGQMILDHAVPALADMWRARLAGGDLVGIAATEAHGGSRIQEITTRAAETTDGAWKITGEKCWVSRLEESSAFVVFVRDPAGQIAAVVVDADAPGLHRQVIDPAGLGGWTWGLVAFDNVTVDPEQHLLGGPGQGLAIFQSHFARFRPLVTACALGCAAGVLDQVRSMLVAKRATGILPRIRDNALIELGAAWADITASALLAFHGLAEAGAASDLAARLGKAHGVDAACRAVNRLAPLVGAAGFQRHHPIAKARFDLAALQYADGIHDSLYRSGGSELLRTVGSPAAAWGRAA